jgi:cysteinyl-tRNA synthetase
MGHVFEFVREANIAMDSHRAGAAGAGAVLDLLAEVDGYLDILSAEEDIEQAVERLIGEREKARAARDFQRADAIREKLREDGIVLEDSRDGVRWRRARG